MKIDKPKAIKDISNIIRKKKGGLARRVARTQAKLSLSKYQLGK